MSPIDEALNELKKGFQLEAEGEQSNDLSKLNQAATHYFAGCRLLKIYLKCEDEMEIQTRNYLEGKISEFDGKGKRLIRHIRGQPSEVIDGMNVSILKPPSQDSSHTRPSQTTSIETDKTSKNISSNNNALNSPQSLSALPIIEAVLVNDEDECDHKQEESKEKSTKQICEEAELLFKKASEYDNALFPYNQHQIEQLSHAKKLYIEVAQSFLDVINILDSNLKQQEEMKQPSSKEEHCSYEQIQAYRDHLQQRVQNTLGK